MDINYSLLSTEVVLLFESGKNKVLCPNAVKTLFLPDLPTKQPQ
jgi:hypothetical protein